MKWVLVLALVARVVLGVAWEVQRRAIQRVAEESERRALESVQKAREAVSADLQGLRESRVKLQRQIEQQAVEVARLRTAAATAKRDVATVRKAGETLRAAPTDEVIAEAARQGYTVRLAAPRAVPVPR